MSTETKPLYLVVVVIGEERELFGFTAKRKAQKFFNEVKHEVDECYISTEKVQPKKQQVV